MVYIFNHHVKDSRQKDAEGQIPFPSRGCLDTVRVMEKLTLLLASINMCYLHSSHPIGLTCSHAPNQSDYEDTTDGDMTDAAFSVEGCGT